MNKQLAKMPHIGSANLDGGVVQTVDARELHAFLEIGRDFHTWLNGRIEQYGFVEGQDFTPVLGKSSGGRPTKEYAISIDMAKELSMVERNEKGREARRYFIDCERIAKEALNPRLPNFNDPVEAARAWADAMEEKQKYELAYKEAKPAVEFVDKYVEKSNLVTFRQACKLLNEKESHVRDYLLNNGVMYRLNGKLTPYSHHLDAGRFVVRTGISSINGSAYVTTMFTPKGVKWLAGELAKAHIQNSI